MSIAIIDKTIASFFSRANVRPENRDRKTPVSLFSIQVPPIKETIDIYKRDIFQVKTIDFSTKGIKGCSRCGNANVFNFMSKKSIYHLIELLEKSDIYWEFSVCSKCQESIENYVQGLTMQINNDFLQAV